MLLSKMRATAEMHQEGVRKAGFYGKAVGLEAERDAFIRLLAIRDQQWTVAVKAVRSALLESRTRSSVKALLGMR